MYAFLYLFLSDELKHITIRGVYQQKHILKESNIFKIFLITNIRGKYYVQILIQLPRIET